jgi:hypothetical protein
MGRTGTTSLAAAIDRAVAELDASMEDLLTEAAEPRHGS